jgi:hypothetical protein
MRNSYKILVGKPEGKRPLGYLGIDGKIILKKILKAWDVRLQTTFIWLRIPQVVGSCEHSDECTSSIKIK